MFETWRNAFKQEDLRKKILYTVFILFIFRLGSAIPTPFINPDALSAMVGSADFLGYLNIMTGGGLEQANVFAMSITPYINSSIIIQLLTVAIPALERLAKEGSEGQRTIKKITRYVTFALAIIQALGLYFMMRRTNGVLEYTTGFSGILAAITIIAVFTAGTAVVVWLGDRISEKGIGNGISMILFAGIISRGPAAAQTLFAWWQLGSSEPKYYFLVPFIIVVFIAMIMFIVLMNDAERRIPVSYAKRVVGRKMYGGQNTHIPIKVNMSGVMPIIFAMSFLSIPNMIGTFVHVEEGGFWDKFFALFETSSWLYAALYLVLIIAFNYFYVAIQYNPIEIANNLRKNNGAIPGIRPGKPTSDFISRVISRITLVGALFLGLIAVFPIVFSAITKANVSLGGTSILIIVGVALETMRTLESQMMMRHHKGFLE